MHRCNEQMYDIGTGLHPHVRGEMPIRKAITLGKETYSKWSDHNAARLGASVAFYSILSFAPLLVLITAIIGLVLGNESAHGALVNEARQAIGEHGATTVESLLKNAQKPGSGIFASLVAFLTLLFGASGVFAELQDALNIMWDAPKQNASGFMALIKQRLFSFGMVLSVGFLLLVSLLLSAGLAYVGHAFGQLVPLPPFILQTINFVVSFAVVTGLFALMLKYVPAVRVPWREVFIGAIITALLFTIGKFLLGIYLAKATVASTYGAAGSLVAVVVWIYYSAQIFFFGAEFTKVYGDQYRGQAADTRTSEQPAHVPETRKPDLVASPKVMAAAVGGREQPVPVPHIETPPAIRNIPASETMPLRVRTPAITSPPITRSEKATGSRATKPKLLAAVAVGFLIARLTRSRVGDQRRTN